MIHQKKKYIFLELYKSISHCWAPYPNLFYFYHYYFWSRAGHQATTVATKKLSPVALQLNFVSKLNLITRGNTFSKFSVSQKPYCIVALSGHMKPYCRIVRTHEALLLHCQYTLHGATAVSSTSTDARQPTSSQTTSPWPVYSKHRNQHRHNEKHRNQHRHNEKHCTQHRHNEKHREPHDHDQPCRQ